MYVGTFWKYSSIAILKKNKNRNKIFAVTKEIKEKNTNKYLLKAWEMEIRLDGIYHPCYGIIPYKTIDFYDLFNPENCRKLPSFTFYSDDADFQMISSNAKDLKIIKNYL